MADTRGRWFYLLLWTLLHLARCAPQTPVCDNYVSVEERGTGQYCEEDLHSMNCSLGPRKYTRIEHDTIFPCQIKRASDLEKSRHRFENLVRCPYPDCEPSLLHSIRLAKRTRYLDGGGSYRWSAIELNFSVPITAHEHFYAAGAIGLTFSSDRNSSVGDPSFEERYRLFDFPTYSYTSPDNDRSNPNHTRILQFPCFMGFRHEPCRHNSEEFTVYSVRLSTFSKLRNALNQTPFTDITYNVTVYNYYVFNYNERLIKSLWKSTIAIALYPGNRDVTVIFDLVPDSITATMYNVSLIKYHGNTTKALGQMLVSKQSILSFKNTEDGKYYVSIATHLADNDIIFTKSSNFTVGNPYLIIAAPHVKEEEESTLSQWLVPVLIAVTSAFALLAFFCYHGQKTRARLNKKRELSSSPKCLLIYSNNSPINSDLAKEFAAHCRRNLHLQVVYDKLEDENESITNEGYSQWCRRKVEDSQAVIILWTPGSDVSSHVDQQTDKEFTTGVTIALDAHTNQHKKLVCMYLVKSHKSTIPLGIRSHARLYYFPKKSPQMFAFLYGHALSRPKNIDISPTFRKLVSDLQSGNYNERMIKETNVDEEIEHDKVQETNSSKDIDKEIETLTRQVFSNISDSTNSSGSNSDRRIYNPQCPVHGEVMNNRHKHSSSKRKRQYAGNHKPHRGYNSLETEPLQSRHPLQQYNNVIRLPTEEFCMENRVTQYRNHDLASSRCQGQYTSYLETDPSCCGDLECVHFQFQENSVHHDGGQYYRGHLTERDIHCDSDFHQTVQSNGHHRHQVPLHNEDSYSRGNRLPVARESEDSFSRVPNNQFYGRNNSFDEVSEETSLTNHNPKFYIPIEEDDKEEAFRNYTSFDQMRSNSVESMISNSSNNSKYSKRSESIDSFELKESLQKFI